MNIRAKLKCPTCGEESEYLVPLNSAEFYVDSDRRPASAIVVCNGVNCNSEFVLIASVLINFSVGKIIAS